MPPFRTFEEWVALVPESITGDPLWKMKVYRQSLFLCAIAEYDVDGLARDALRMAQADQIRRCGGSISANIAEGYGRGTSKDRCRFYEYALGSAREARDWYFQVSSVLGSAVSQHRMDLLSQIVRQLLTVLSAERTFTLREKPATYAAKMELSDGHEIPFACGV